MSKGKGKKCPGCGKLIHRRSEYCYSCSMKLRWARGDYDSEEHRQLRSTVQKEAQNRPKVKQRRSEAMKAAWARGDYGTLGWRHKNAEAIKAKWERGDYDGVFDSPAIQRKKSEGLKAAWARGDFNRPKTCRKRSEAMKVRWASGDMDGVFQSPSSIELALIAALDVCGLNHISQYRPSSYNRVYDEFVLPNVLIEAHGNYWHSLPGRPERDAEKAAWAEENGYRLVVMWEHEIKEQGALALVHERVLPLLNVPNELREV